MVVTTGCVNCCPTGQHLDTNTGLCVDDTNWMKWLVIIAGLGLTYEIFKRR